MFEAEGPSRTFAVQWDYLRNPDLLFTLLIGALFVIAVTGSLDWDMEAKLTPIAMGSFGIVFTVILAASTFLLAPRAKTAQAVGGPGGEEVQDEVHFDIQADYGDLGSGTIYSRAFRYLLWCMGYIFAAQVIGLMPAILVFMIAYIRFEARESWITTLVISGVMWGLSYLLFHIVLRVLWPQALLGDWLPILRDSRYLNLM